MHSLVREDMKHLFEAFPHDAHPMQILASEVSAGAMSGPAAPRPPLSSVCDFLGAALTTVPPPPPWWRFLPPCAAGKAHRFPAGCARLWPW
ncbi:MAG: hypothetical protein ACWA5A_02530 [Marinibacterium sp.]